MNHTCKTCQFYDTKIGACHRYPPTSQMVPQRSALSQVGLAPISYFPPTQPENWCGEYVADLSAQLALTK